MATEDEKLGFGPWAFLTLILVALLLFAFVSASQFRGSVGAIGVGGLIFLAAAMVGALLGFIFAVPRVAATETWPPTSGDAKSKLLSTNTNLERISDWLTTMLVGVGLSQLTNLNGTFLQFRYFLAEAATVYDVGGKPSSGVLPAIGPFILILGAASGFLFMYLMTRLVLVGFFRDSEEMLSRLAVAAVRVAVNANTNASDGAGGVPSPSPAGGTPGAAAPSQANDMVNLTASGTTPVSATLLRAAQATSLSNDDAIEVMFELLYETGGYRGVIQMSGVLSSSAIVKRPEYWFYLAAAFGQQMQHTDPDSADRQSARDNALDAARRAVRIDKSFRSRLWEISNPRSSDNDLSLLREDPDFLRIVGRS